MKRNMFCYGLILTIGLFTWTVFAGSPAGVIVSSERVPVLVNDAKTAEVQMLLSHESLGHNDVYLGRIRFGQGASIPEHIHENSIEMIYILSGMGDFKMAGKTTRVKSGDALYIPPKTPHSFTNSGQGSVEAVQVYIPGGPEERFRAWQRK